MRLSARGDSIVRAVPNSLRYAGNSIRVVGGLPEARQPWPHASAPRGRREPLRWIAFYRSDALFSGRRMPRPPCYPPPGKITGSGVSCPALFRPGLRRREPLRLNVLYRGNG